MKAFEDKNHVGNSDIHHTGEECIEPGCTNPAGTAWGPYWCWQCNVKRIKRLTNQFEEMLKGSEDEL